MNRGLRVSSESPNPSRRSGTQKGPRNAGGTVYDKQTLETACCCPHWTPIGEYHPVCEQSAPEYGGLSVIEG